MSAHPSPEQLGAYLDGELDASARAAVDTHLRECAECGAHLVDLSAVDDAARALPLSVPDGYFDEFALRVRSRLARKTPARWRPPVWGLAAAAALLLAVITPLALQEHRAAPTTAVDRAVPEPAAPAPAAPSGGAFERDRTLGYKQDEGVRQMAPPTTAGAPLTRAVPQAPAPGAVASKDQDHFEERPRDLRLARRDQTGAAGSGRAEASPASPLPAEAEQVRAKAEPKRENAAAEPGKADEAKAQGKLSDEQLEKLRSAGYVAPAPPPAVGQRQHGPRSQSAVPSAAEPRKSAAAPESKDKERFATPPDEKAAAGADAPAGDLQEQVEVTTQPRDMGQGLGWAKYRSLADGDPPRSDGDARLLREAWRTFASENPTHPQADEARVRVVEAGVLAYRLGRRQQDREIALRDGRAYLDRPTSPQAARVRAALKTLEPAAP